MTNHFNIRFTGISMQGIQKIRKAFEEYASLYLSNRDESYSEHIKLKYEHIHRVCTEIKKLSKTFSMNDEEIAFTEVLALLHDIGRFEQFDKYNTFADAKSENHSIIALRVISEIGLQNEFSDFQNEIISRSILNHNLPKIPDSEAPQIKFYSQILRDADKLDIWKVSLEYNIFHKIRTENFPSEYEIPQELVNCFSDSRIIMLSQVKSFYDSILFRLSWVYDLSFPYSLSQFSERKIAHKLLQKLPASPQLEIIREYVHSFVEKEIKNIDL